MPHSKQPVVSVQQDDGCQGAQRCSCMCVCHAHAGLLPRVTHVGADRRQPVAAALSVADQVSSLPRQQVADKPHTQLTGSRQDSMDPGAGTGSTSPAPAPSTPQKVMLPRPTHCTARVIALVMPTTLFWPTSFCALHPQLHVPTYAAALLASPTLKSHTVSRRPWNAQYLQFFTPAQHAIRSAILFGAPQHSNLARCGHQPERLVLFRANKS